MTIADLYEIYRKHPVISTDTRKITDGCIFFALKGPNFNANTFAAEALQKGAAYCVIDEAQYRANDRCVLVDDVLKTLQDLAKHHRRQLNIPVIAIVGSNGKTTTKELITSVLKQGFNVWATPGNLNNHIGLPLTLLQLNTSHQIAIIEMGANHVGENAELCEIALPGYGVVTNNGKDHLEGFGDIEGVAKSNSELYYFLLKNGGLAFVNANDEWLMRMSARLSDRYTYAANTPQRKQTATCEGHASEVVPQVVFQYKNTEIRSHLSGDYNFDNIMAAVAMGEYFRLNEAQIKTGVEAYLPSNNRSQIIKTPSNTVYMDAYNANPSSMEVALRNFATMPGDKVAVLGDMFELGKYAAEEHQLMVNLCKELKLEKVILVGKDFAATQHAYVAFESTAEAKAYLASHPLKNNLIFLKGSRGMKLETLMEVIG